MDVRLNNQRVMVALDVQGREKALGLAKALQDSGCWLKVGLELYAYTGPEMIHELKSLGFPIFLDLKLHDIPTTVERAIRGFVQCGVDMINVHCSGGYDMMAKAANAVREEGSKLKSVPKVIGVTVLTSMSETQFREEMGVQRDLRDHVVELAKLAEKAGLDGVVASAREAQEIRKNTKPDFLIVTPGIRPAWSEAQDQARVLTPHEALAAGSSYLVVGRPITRAENPRHALERLWE
ncbi:orotidine-5'-phosphate decarboxylase [Desulfosporosinus youngiae]|uniref:Orotidine 5'-phosphate decarboxylase n=1 Tax=Desulfosporosinus youngiae DSM 17734 TaxID=768710 RepID=H5XY02_9FIRM|nr:orotidine-5'-phosphate decarboxylase [Desulfosporosinus youngiae]EHQ91505.1 orotidine 5'-phosphate decarboxylase, subfamily 1 [Desulfosporosinus youngiae DSM 17734]